METSTSKSTFPRAQESSLAQIIRYAQTVMNIMLALVGALMIHQYDPSTPPYSKDLSFTAFGTPFDVPTVVADPTFTMFLLAIAFYLSAISSVPVPPSKDTYQYYFLAAGALAGHLCTTKWGWDDDYFMVLKSFLPLSVTMAAVLSLFFHTALRFVERNSVYVSIPEKQE